MRTPILLLVAALFLIGCGKEPEGAAGKREEKSEQSLAGQVIDDFTGKTAVDAGKRARSAIDRATAARDRQMEEALGE